MRALLVPVGVLVGSCVISAPTTYRETLHARASFDMQCPDAELHVTEIDNLTAGVEGCGQRGTYVYNAAAGTWILNSPGVAAPSFEPAPSLPGSDRPAGVPPGSPPGTLPGSLPGAPPGSPPGTPPGGWPHR